MVYRGKPSAGCDACRKAKKRCTLELPKCSRCVKLKKDCSGYRDTTQLQIQDESEAVRQRAIRQKARQTQAPSHCLAAPRSHALTNVHTPASTSSDSSQGSDEVSDFEISSRGISGEPASTSDEPDLGQALISVGRSSNSIN
ncbi:hypothetical protein LTR53_016645, partial [Teratosphaeriaceae sp. CCFEE 6253]